MTPNGMSKDVYEWQCRLPERVSSRNPELMRKMRVLTQRMRAHFQDDPEGLKKWDAYEENVLYAYERNMPISLSRPVMTPNSVLYDALMKRKAYERTPIAMLSVGLGKLKHGVKTMKLVGARAVAMGAVTGLAIGLAVGSKLQKTK